MCGRCHWSSQDSLLLGRSLCLSFALIDNDCVPVTLFEAQDLIELAHRQHQWVDLIGRVRSESHTSRGIGMLLFTEAHLEYNAGLSSRLATATKAAPWRTNLALLHWPRTCNRAASHWSPEPGHQFPRARRPSTALCMLPLLEYRCKLPLVCALCGHCRDYTCVRISGLALLRTLLGLAKVAPFIGPDNEWRRCVCRFCTSHLSRFKNELPAR